MIDNKIEQELHQRQFEGKNLSKEEAAILANWYAEQDNLEASSLKIEVSKPNLFLPIQIKETVNQLTKLTQRIQQVLQENDKIRVENSIVVSKNN